MKTCCVIGHREFEKTKELEIKIKDLMICLIENEKVSNFLFGSKSAFTDFCYDIITELIKKYSNINRIYVRAEYPIISEEYYNYLRKHYEESYFYDEKLTTNKFSYINRNKFMIDKSDICVFYYNTDYIPKTKTQSGTSIAYEYALKKDKKILNILS